VDASSLMVGAVQAEPVPGKVAQNAIAAARLVRVGAQLGAQVVVLPELFLPAYHPPALYADPEGTSVQADEAGRIADERLDPLRGNGIVTVIGASVSYPDGRRTCSTLIVSREGEITAAYDKQHLWGPDENALFTPGSRGTTLTVDGWRFGLGICYDGCFPEHGRAAAGDDVDGYLVPSGYLDGSQHRRDLYYAARALDNTMYVAFANAVGGEKPWRFNGGAAIYDPQGRCLTRGDDESETVVVATMEKLELDRTRAAHTMLLDRHVDLGGARRQISV
jgi:predicted amidohydrolase